MDERGWFSNPFFSLITRQGVLSESMRGTLQHDENDCGLACILTICKFLKIKVDENKIRRNIFLGNEGLSLYGITEVFDSVGIKSLTVEGSMAELFALSEQIKLPIIVMVRENNEYHYVVLYKTNVKKVYLWDPNRGKRIVSRNYFGSIWSGYAVYITEILEQVKHNIVTTRTSICWDVFLQYEKYLFMLLLFSVLLIGASISATYIYKMIIEQIETGIKIFTDELKYYFLVTGICYIFITILFLTKNWLILYIQRETEIVLRQKFVNSMLNMSVQKKEDYTSGGILDRYNRLSVVVETMSSVFAKVFIECISLVAGVILLSNISINMFGMVLIIVVSYIVSFVLTKKKLYGLSKTIMDKESLLLTHIKETIENISTLKNYANNKYKGKVGEEIRFVKNKEYLLNKMSVTIGILLGSVEDFVMLVVLIYGIHSVIIDDMSLGTLLAFESFVGFFLSPVKNLLGILPSVQETILTFRRIEDIFAYNAPEEKDVESSKKIKGKVRVHNLDVAYGFDKPILENISFNIDVGEKVFLTGVSGCGKSTLAKTLAGFIKYHRGDIIWDDVISADTIDLSYQITYLSQNAEIFSGSIKDNILMWEEHYDQTLFDEVLKNIGIYQILDSRGLTLENQLLESGTNLSGGERQRIALARALMKNSSVYIFDESTCHLDYESEEKILRYIRTRLERNTCIFISHNVHLLKEQDKVIFIDNIGKLHIDTHLQMKKDNIEYRQMFWDN